MVIFNYTHAFTFQQLDLILTQYLQLGPYYQCLNKVLQRYTSRFEGLPIIDRHNPDKQHPIRLPINFYNYKNKESSKIDMDSYQGEVDFIYPLTIIVEVLNSNQFYLELPKNVIVNGLLTTTNINIIVRTLTILSEELSKLIGTTLDSIGEKQLNNYINTLLASCFKGDQIKTGNSDPNNPPYSSNENNTNNSSNNFNFLDQFLQKLPNKGNQPNTQQKYPTTEYDIQTIKIDSQTNINAIQSDYKLQSSTKIREDNKSNMRRRQSRVSIFAQIINRSQQSKLETKDVIVTLKSLIKQDKLNVFANMVDGKDQPNRAFEQLQNQFARKPRVFVECDYCKDYRNYLLESTGLSYFDLQEISRIPSQTYNILKRIKNVTNAFTLYLKETNRITVPADINTINGILSNINIAITEQVWEDVSLNPLKADRTARGRKYHSKSNQHKYSKKNHTLIKQLQPYFKGVYNYKPYSQNQYSVDQLLRMCLKAPQIKDVQKRLIQKYMNEARVKKQGKDIQTFCITKQQLNTKTVANANTEHHLTFDSSKNTFTPDSKPVLDQIQLLRQYEKQQRIINQAKTNCRPIHVQINDKYQQQVNLVNTINKYRFKNKANDYSKIMQNSQSSFRDLSSINQACQGQKFKMIIYQQYMRNEGFNVTKNNISMIINQNLMKISKSLNSFRKANDTDTDRDNITQSLSPQSNYNYETVANNSTASLVHLKTQQDNDTDFDKKETQIYNKMLLNGQTIRNEIINQVEYGQAVIYESYQDLVRKLQSINQSDSDGQNNQQGQQPENNMQFLTICGNDLKKSKSSKNQDSKHNDLLANSVKSQANRLSKTQNNKQQKKYSLISINVQKAPCQPNRQQKLQLQNKASKSKEQFSIKQIKPKSQHKCQQVPNKSLNDWNQNFELRKPAWLDQYLDKTHQTNTVKPAVRNGKTLLQNQRFLAFQQKCFLQQTINGGMNKNQTLKTPQNNSQSQVKTMLIHVSNSSANLKRPSSAASGVTSTTKNMNRTLSGKKISCILGKQFVIQNNSLLTKIFKQNVTGNVLRDAKTKTQKDKFFNQLSSKIQKSKFRDNYFN